MRVSKRDVLVNVETNFLELALLGSNTPGNSSWGLNLGFGAVVHPGLKVRQPQRPRYLNTGAA